MIIAQVYLAMLLVTLVAVAIVYGKVKLVEAIEVSMAAIQAPPGPGHPSPPGGHLQAAAPEDQDEHHVRRHRLPAGGLGILPLPGGPH